MLLQLGKLFFYFLDLIQKERSYQRTLKKATWKQQWKLMLAVAFCPFIILWYEAKLSVHRYKQDIWKMLAKTREVHHQLLLGNERDIS